MSRTIHGEWLLIFNEVPGLQVFLFPTLKLIGPCRNADSLVHSFFLKLCGRGNYPARVAVVALAGRSVLARQKNHVIPEIELDFL
jgi:hypothetical protein